MNITYRSGRQIFVTGEHDDRRIAVLLDGSAADLAGALWELVERPFEPIELIDILASRGLANLPDFAYVIGDAQGLRVFLRGDLTVEIVTITGDSTHAESHHGAGVSTWTEFTAAPAATVRLASGAPVESDPYPLRGGVVRAAEATLVWSELPAERPVAAVPEPIETAEAPASAPADAESASPTGTESEPEPAGEGSGQTVPVSVTELFPDAPPAPDEIQRELNESIAHTEVFAGAFENFATAQHEAVAGDQDGHTISAAEIARLRAARAGAYDPPSEEPARPNASLRLPSGEVIGVDRPVYIGRSPAARQAGGAALPRLVKISGEDVDISRTHLEVKFDGPDLVATDLSTNGTIVIREGLEPQRLQPRTASLLTDGTVLQLSAITSIVVSVGDEAPDGG